MWGISLTHFVIFYVGSFSYTPLAVLCGEMLVHGPRYFIWGVSFTWPMGGISLTHSVLFYVCVCVCVCVCGGGGVLTLLVLIFMQEIAFHALCYLISGFGLTHPMQVYVGRFSNSMQCVLSCEEFPLYSSCCFMWEISLTILRAMN